MVGVGCLKMGDVSMDQVKGWFSQNLFHQFQFLVVKIGPESVDDWLMLADVGPEKFT